MAVALRGQGTAGVRARIRSRGFQWRPPIVGSQAEAMAERPRAAAGRPGDARPRGELRASVNANRALVPGPGCPGRTCTAHRPCRSGSGRRRFRDRSFAVHGTHALGTAHLQRGTGRGSYRFRAAPARLARWVCWHMPRWRASRRRAPETPSFGRRDSSTADDLEPGGAGPHRASGVGDRVARLRLPAAEPRRRCRMTPWGPIRHRVCPRAGARVSFVSPFPAKKVPGTAAVRGVPTERPPRQPNRRQLASGGRYPEAISARSKPPGAIAGQ